MNLWTFCSVLHSVICNSGIFGEIIFKGAMGHIDYDQEHSLINIICQEPMQLTDVFSPLNITLTFTEVAISKCQPKNYFNELQSLNINASVIKVLKLFFDQNKPLLPENYTKGMKIKKICVINNGQGANELLLQNVPNFIEPLTDLEILHLDGAIQVPSLPETMRLLDLGLFRGATVKNWGNCHNLGTLALLDFFFYNTIYDFLEWPPMCTKLRSLIIHNMIPESVSIVMKKLKAATPNLLRLTITNCLLHELPIEMMRSASNLTFLDLSGNYLADVSFQSFPSLKSLTTLKISGNQFDGSVVKHVVPKLPTLRELVLDDLYPTENDFFGFIDKKLQSTSIESIGFGYTPYNLDSFYSCNFPNLKYVSMYSPKAADDDLKILNLPLSATGDLTIDFGNFTFRTISFNEDDYETLRRENSSSPYKGRNLTVLLKTIKCDCDAGWLSRALRDFPHSISMPRIQCADKDGSQLLDVPRKHLECNATKSDGWVYTQSWLDGSVIAECDQEAWMKMAPVYPLRGLNVSGRGINTFQSNLPKTLQWLDLRHNRISHASAEEASALFAAGRRVWLADNMLLCDCRNHALLDAIQLHKEMVQDYDLLKCVGTGESISLISTAELCHVALIVSLSAAGILVVVAGLIAVLLRRYGEQLRMFLFSRGWCISCLQKQDVDDKPYDAFISFAHEDREYVMETLLPGLENAPEKFRVCVHHRDWLVGDWIPAQILRSVNLSKRTLILLSRNFVASTWSTLELRCSLANMIEDTNAKVLVLIKDDVLDMDLDMELRLYLTYNTYLRCDDQWFWEKLRYAMPHRATTKMSRSVDINTRERGEEIAMRTAK